jgi:uncharacterized membrane protein YphA (DoxX/SURF4 family)
MSQPAYAVGRILMPIVFIVSRSGKLMNVKGVAGQLATKNVPVPPIEA